ncbi:unnamed protein product [Effrenium voratum]|nr:unnamed protein product [Effrenium voratum]
MYRKILLGKNFWERLDYERIKYQTVVRTKRVRMPFTKKKIEVKLPGRCTMQELLEYSRRNTAVQGGKRVTSQDAGEAESTLAKERDLQIQRSPILNMIRNPRCMYYIPQEGGKNIQKQQGHRSELDVGEQDIESDGEGDMDMLGDDTGGGVITGAPNNAEHMLQIVTAMQMKQNERVIMDESSDDEGAASDSDLALSDGGDPKRERFSPQMARGRVVPLLLVRSDGSVFATLACVNQLFSTFVAPFEQEIATRSERSNLRSVAMHAEDPLDFVGKTGKKIEANSENEQLIDLDNFWAIFFTVVGNTLWDTVQGWQDGQLTSMIFTARLQQLPQVSNEKAGQVRHRFGFAERQLITVCSITTSNLNLGIMSQDKRVQLEAVILKSVGESLPREGWVELMCLLDGKPRAADLLLKELGDEPEISVTDFLDLLFDEALKQELEQTKPQLRAAQAKAEEKEQES